MADRSFEQQVREELSDLRISPDTAVWTGIEAALQKERKRRMLWLFLLLGILVGAGMGGYFFTGSLEMHPGIEKAERITAAGRNEKKQILSPQAKEPLPETAPNAAIKESSSVVTGAGRNNTVKTSDVPGMGNRYMAIVPALIKGGQSQGQQQGKVSILSVHETVDSATNFKEVWAKADSLSVSSQKENTSLVPSAKHDIDPVKAITQDKDEVKTAVADTPKRMKKQHAWQWAVHAAAGYGKPVNPVSIGVKHTALAGSISTPPSGGGLGTYYTSEPAVNSKTAFQLGIEMSRPLGKKFRLALTLDYQLYQTETQAGNRIDSTTYFANYAAYNNNGYYYTSGNSSRYHSSYHFLYTGAVLYRQSKLFGMVPLRWQLGAGLQWLIHTNALVFDAGTGRLFSDNSLLAKIQPQVSLGFDMALDRKSSIYLGPSIQYTLLKLSSSGAADKHLFFAGAKVSVALPEKKKKGQ